MSLIDANPQVPASPQDDPASASAEPEKDAATLAAEALASERRRHAGEAAAHKAEKERADALAAKLSEYEKKDRSAKDQELSDVASLRQALEDERRARAEEKANAYKQVLDVKFPISRAKFPGITDEVQLAELEAILRVDAVETPGEPPTPRSTNPSRAASPANPAPAEKSSKELLADMKAQFGGQSITDLFAGDQTPN